MVLVKFRWQEYLKEFGWNKEINEKVAEATVLSGTWNKFDKGIMKWNEFLEEFISNDNSAPNSSL